jgi:hypothetical protein
VKHRGFVISEHYCVDHLLLPPCREPIIIQSAPLLLNHPARITRKPIQTVIWRISALMKAKDLSREELRTPMNLSQASALHSSDSSPELRFGQGLIASDSRIQPIHSRQVNPHPISGCYQHSCCVGEKAHLETKPLQAFQAACLTSEE